MNPALGNLIKAAADKHGIPYEIALGMVQTESSGNAKATRHEPAFQRRYIDPLHYPAKEARQRATSWGLLQIMGETARSIGFKLAFEELLVPETGLEWGLRYLAKLRAKYPAEPWRVIVRAYNGGPGNRHNETNHYPDRVLINAGMVSWPDE